MSDDTWLAEMVRSVGAVAGTVHRLDGDLLVLTGSVRIPEVVLARTRTIPRGKGMAGLAWLRGVPVQTCDLQADRTGDVQPGARAVQAQAAIAIPVFEAGEICAVVGLAWSDDRVLEPSDVGRLTTRANSVLEGTSASS